MNSNASGQTFAPNSFQQQPPTHAFSAGNSNDTASLEPARLNKRALDSSVVLSGSDQVKRLKSDAQTTLLSHAPLTVDASTTAQDATENNSEPQFGRKYQGLKALQTLAESHGFKVPPFIGLTLAQAKRCIESQALTPELIAFLQLHEARFGRFMVRSSSDREDVEGQSNAGCFKTVANVSSQSSAILAALKQVVDSFSSASAQAQSALYAKGDLSEPMDEAVNSNGAGDGIIIQAMVGEVVGSDVERHVPVAGVGLSPDPRSSLPGSFHLSYALGHGEAVVNSQVQTDSVTGRLLPNGEIHARHTVETQPMRLGPNASGGLKGINNRDIGSRKDQPKLTEKAYRQVAQALDAVASQYRFGGDIEFVQHKDQLYLVQQRSQDVLPRKCQPSFLNHDVIEQHMDKAHAIKVASYREYGAYTVARSERIVCPSLDKAFYQHYLKLDPSILQSTIKAVFVRPPANPNAHAALMFRQQGIAIIEVQDPSVFAQLEKVETVTIDEQQSTALMGVSVDEAQCTDGWTSYPAPALYSLPNHRTSLNQHEQATLQSLLSMTDQQDNPYMGQSLKALMVQLKEALLNQPLDTATTSHQGKANEGADRRGRVNQLVAALLSQSYRLFKMDQAAHSQPQNHTFAHHLGHVTNELVVDLVRIVESVERCEPLMTQLMYLNWVDAAVHQQPKAHPTMRDLVSVNSQLSQLRLDGAFKSWSNTLFPTQSPVKGRAVAKLLYAFAHQLSDEGHRQSWLIELGDHWIAEQGQCEGPSEQPTALMSMAKRAVEWSRLGLLNEKYADLMHQKGEGFKAEFAKVVNNITENHLNSSYKRLTSLNQYLLEQQSAWSDSTQFNRLMKVAVGCAKLVDKALDSIDSHDFPNQSMAILNQLQTFSEQMDLALKAIITAPTYPNREASFAKLLKVYLYAVSPVLNHAYVKPANKVMHYSPGDTCDDYDSDNHGDFIKGLEQKDEHSSFMRKTMLKNSVKGYCGNISALLNHCMDQQKKQPAMQHKQPQGPSILSLYPQEGMNVQDYLFDKSHTQPIGKRLMASGQALAKKGFSLGDLHTILHQNSRMGLGAMIERAATHLNLPESIRSLKAQIEKGLKAGALSEVHERRQLVKLVSIQKVDGNYQLSYAVPLREHGVRLIFQHDKAAETMNVSIAMDGKNENRRWNVITSMIQNAKASGHAVNAFRSDVGVWPDPATAADFNLGWLETDLKDPSLPDRIAHHLDTIVQVSFDFWEDGFNVEEPFHDFYIPNTSEGESLKVERRLYLEYQAVDEFNQRVASGDIDSVTELVVNRLGFSLHSDVDFLQDEYNFNNETEEKMTREAFTAAIKTIISEEGVMSGRCGLYELGDKVVSRLDHLDDDSSSSEEESSDDEWINMLDATFG